MKIMRKKNLEISYNTLCQLHKILTMHNLSMKNASSVELLHNNGLLAGWSACWVVVSEHWSDSVKLLLSCRIASDIVTVMYCVLLLLSILLTVYTRI